MGVYKTYYSYIKKIKLVDLLWYIGFFKLCFILFCLCHIKVTLWDHGSMKYLPFLGPFPCKWYIELMFKKFSLHKIFVSTYWKLSKVNFIVSLFLNHGENIQQLWNHCTILLLMFLPSFCKLELHFKVSVPLPYWGKFLMWKKYEVDAIQSISDLRCPGKW